MFKKLQQHWGVSEWRFFLILCTFAVTGTFTAWVSKGITQWVDVEKFSFTWWLLKIAVLIIGYQFFILFFGFLFGQFSFFWKFEKKILTRMGIMKKDKKLFRLAIFASGKGSNAKKIIEYFSDSIKVSIALIVCNKAGAGVVDVARKFGIDVFYLTRQDTDSEALLSVLKKNKVELIVLAGYLWKIPPSIIQSFPRRIINIHPALLPKYGGKGMYGSKVHEAVISNQEKESGITIHFVDDIYDNGDVIFQQSCPVDLEDTPVTLAEKIQLLEHKYYPRLIRSILEKQNHS